MNTISIGQLGQQAGVATSKLRYYDGLGLLRPAHREAGQRRYGPDAIKHLAHIQRAQKAGFSLKDIAAFLKARNNGPSFSSLIQTRAIQRATELRVTIQKAEESLALLESGRNCTCDDFHDCDMLN
jgi:DNA-binding transcriptional MerR regulator